VNVLLLEYITVQEKEGTRGEYIHSENNRTVSKQNCYLLNRILLLTLIPPLKLESICLLLPAWRPNMKREKDQEP